MIKWEDIQPTSTRETDVRERWERLFHLEVGEAYSAGFFDCKRMCKAAEDSSDD